MLLSPLSFCLITFFRIFPFLFVSQSYTLYVSVTSAELSSPNAISHPLIDHAHSILLRRFFLSFFSNFVSLTFHLSFFLCYSTPLSVFLSPFPYLSFYVCLSLSVSYLSGNFLHLWFLWYCKEKVIFIFLPVPYLSVCFLSLSNLFLSYSMFFSFPFV